MSEGIQAVRGMNDVLPTQIGTWQFLEGTVRELVASYSFEEMRVPVVEQTRLFKRAIGELTDVVSKEMYSFEIGDESLTLRPEATAGIARALISNGMLRGPRHKLWCIGPMFRHETPQKGRYRQFHQLDVEAVGFPGPDIDAELIAMTARLWRQLGITRVKLQLNSLGTADSRKAYRDLLVTYFHSHEAWVHDVVDPDGPDRRAQRIEMRTRLGIEMLGEHRRSRDDLAHLRILAVENAQRIAVEPASAVGVQTRFM